MHHKFSACITAQIIKVVGPCLHTQKIKPQSQFRDPSMMLFPIILTASLLASHGFAQTASSTTASTSSSSNAASQTTATINFLDASGIPGNLNGGVISVNPSQTIWALGCQDTNPSDCPLVGALSLHLKQGPTTVTLTEGTNTLHIDYTKSGGVTVFFRGAPSVLGDATTIEQTIDCTYTGTTEGTCSATLGNAVSGSSFNFTSTSGPAFPSILTQSVITITSGADLLGKSGSGSSSVSARSLASSSISSALSLPSQVSGGTRSSSGLEAPIFAWVVSGVSGALIAMLMH